MPRLRAAFGVGAKADVLLYLLTAARADPTVRDLATALDYTSRAVRAAADDMVLAGLIDGSDSRPRRYSVRRGPWSDLLLAGGDFPVWRPCSHALLLVSHLLAWIDAQEVTDATPYLRASSARDLVELRAPPLRSEGDFPRAPQGAGAAYRKAFETYLGAISDWLERST